MTDELFDKRDLLNHLYTFIRSLLAFDSYTRSRLIEWRVELIYILMYSEPKNYFRTDFSKFFAKMLFSKM